MAAKRGDEPKCFRVSARTILQLGGELISSDGIAFYELIKNAVDAGSKNVHVDVQMTLPLDAIQQLRAVVDESGEVNKRDLKKLKAEIVSAIIADAPRSNKLRKTVADASSLDDLLAAVLDANSITFRDTGTGMTLGQLDNIYLTVGTPHRLNERKSGSQRVVLGEKGIGRLSAMRLGSRLHVTTATAADEAWNELEIDWNDFGLDASQLLEDIEIAPYRGKTKDDPASHGTTIHITDLSTTWSLRRLSEIAGAELCRFTDPFTESKRFPIHLRLNGSSVPIPRMSDILNEHAHALVEGRLTIEGEPDDPVPVLEGKVQYLFSGSTGNALSGRILTFRYENAEIASLLTKAEDPDVGIDAVLRLGPFSMKCLWFNRRLLKAVEIDDSVLDLKRLVRQWSGGLMVYRDGFRVPPYGGPDDDWLDLDRGALAAQGYKVNRAQLVGKVDISARRNARLRDQTNREGLRDCPEKRALAGLLKHILEVEFRGYLKEVDDEIRNRDRISFAAFTERLAEAEEKINNSLDKLTEIEDEHPDLEIGPLAKRLQRAFHSVVEVVSEVQDTVETVEDEKARVLHLAALGLSIEKLAHELNRASKHALDALSQMDGSANASALKRSAVLQLQSLRKRLQNLDPLLTPARQTKQEFDLGKEIKSVLEGFQAKFERHGVTPKFSTKGDAPITVKAVRAMFIQVLENLIDNSVYWLSVGKRRKVADEAPREIRILLDGNRNVIEVADTGPGIAPENRERVFRPFFTLKPAGHGKGLGLYIAREIAEYHGGTLSLTDKGLRSTGRLNTFELDFSSGRV
ncbi:MAG: HAMP domain-containing histidine kinase [Pirellulaceae bacterium]|nr:HAMP domain-containing histidine kinase [Pirellulaceae bacterium]